MTATVARTATAALTNAFLPYLQEIAELGVEQSLRTNPGLAKGVCTYGGQCINAVVARTFDLQPGTLSRLLNTLELTSRN